MKNRNRLFALLLSVMMVFTYMPAMAFAEGEEPTGDDPVVNTDEQTGGEVTDPDQTNEGGETDGAGEAEEEGPRWHVDRFITVPCTTEDKKLTLTFDVDFDEYTEAGIEPPELSYAWYQHLLNDEGKDPLGNGPSLEVDNPGPEDEEDAAGDDFNYFCKITGDGQTEYVEFRIICTVVATNLVFESADGTNSISIPEHRHGNWYSGLTGDLSEESDEDAYYHYYVKDCFADGDKLIATVAGVENVYTYDSEQEEFVDEKGYYFNSYDWYADQSYDNQWVLGGEYTCTLEYGGYEIEVPVHIVEAGEPEEPEEPADPRVVESMSLKRVNGDTLRFEEETFGYMDTNSAGEEFFRYWTEDYISEFFEDGDELTLKYEGTDEPVTYTYYGWDPDKHLEMSFAREMDDGSWDIIDYSNFRIRTNQRGEWKVGGEGYAFTLSYKGNTLDIPVEIVEGKKVTSMSYKRANGDAVQFEEEAFGEMDPEAGFFRYWTEDYIAEFFEDGDELTLKFEGDDEPVTYTFYGWDEEKGLEQKFARQTEEGWDTINYRKFEIESNQTEAWKVGGEGYTFTLSYKGQSQDIPVEIIENPVESIEFSRDGYSESSPVELIENVSGFKTSETNPENEDEELYYFYYSFVFKDGDVLTVNYTDGTSVGYVYTDDTEAETFVNPDNPEDVILFEEDPRTTYGSDQSYDNQWKLGEDHFFTIGLNGKTCDVAVTIKEGIVSSVEFERPGLEGDAIEITQDTGEGYYCFNYEAGDLLKVQYRIGDNLYNVTYTYVDEERDGGMVHFFETEDKGYPEEIPLTLEENETFWTSLYYIEGQPDPENWIPGEVYNCELSYQGKSVMIPMKIVGDEPAADPVEESEKYAKETLDTADEEVAAAKKSSGTALAAADALNENSEQAEIDAAKKTAAKAVEDAQKAIEAAQTALDAAQAYYDAAKEACDKANASSAEVEVNDIRLSALDVSSAVMLMAEAEGLSAEDVLKDAETKLAAAKYNKAAASNTLTNAEKAYAKIASVNTTKAIAKAEEVANDPNATDAEKTAAVKAAQDAAKEAAEHAANAEAAAKETATLVEAANADENLDADRAESMKTLVTETSNSEKETTEAKAQAEENQKAADKILAEAAEKYKKAKETADASAKAAAAEKTKADAAKKEADAAKQAAADATPGTAEAVAAAKTAVEKAEAAKTAADAYKKAAEQAKTDADAAVAAANNADAKKEAEQMASDADTALKEASTAATAAATAVTDAKTAQTKAEEAKAAEDQKKSDAAKKIADDAAAAMEKAKKVADDAKAAAETAKKAAETEGQTPGEAALAAAKAAVKVAEDNSIAAAALKDMADKAKAAADEAKAAANNSEAAKAAEKLAEAAKTVAADAEKAVADAKAAVENAKKVAEDAEKAAENEAAAVKNAEAAQATAEKSAQAAADAKTAAADAKTAADAAKKTADEAKAAADKATPGTAEAVEAAQKAVDAAKKSAEAAEAAQKAADAYQAAAEKAKEDAQAANDAANATHDPIAKKKASDSVKTADAAVADAKTTAAAAKTAANDAKSAVTTAENAKKTADEAKANTGTPEITLSATDYTYKFAVKKVKVGKKKKKQAVATAYVPTVASVKLNGKTLTAADYDVSYSDPESKALGTYTVTVTLKGKYKGTGTATYNINPKPAKISKPAKGKKKMTVKWKKAAKNDITYKALDGYEIQYSLSSDFSSDDTKTTTASKKAKSKAIKKLQSKQVYYVRIRTYKKVGSMKLYSNWSAVKSVKVK